MKEHTMKHAAVLLVTLALSLSALAQQAAPGDRPATRDDVLRMLDATGMRQQSERMQTMMLHQMKTMSPSFDNQHLTAEQRAKMQEINDRMMADVMKAYSVSDALDDMVPLYQKYFTRDDVAAITTFYLSPTGQKFLEKMPGIMSDYMSTLMPKLQARMKPIMEKYQKEMEAVTSTAPQTHAPPAEPKK
jgi:hypothetical protein